MRLQGDSIEEGNVKVEVLEGEIPFQSIYDILKEFFIKEEKEIKVFNIISAVREKDGWHIRSVVQYSTYFRSVMVVVGYDGKILQLNEEFRGS